jgi:hypothetical protein
MGRRSLFRAIDAPRSPFGMVRLPRPHAATPHTNHHSTLTHPPANPSLPLADLPPPPHGIPTPNHPVEAHTPLHSSLTHSHPARMRASGWLTPALRALQATDSAHFGVTGRARMHFFRLVSLVIDARAWFERFWPEMERHARDCVLLAVCWVCPGVLRWSFML